ncbi:MAG: hypothetical protein K6B28_08345 [Lachnospiraceae bacterium]|nr:hypothetical protein [Lachnospiraceae bacterium]
MTEDVTIRFSGILGEKGNRYIAVSFSDGKRTCEGSIPKCRITKNNGFDEDELASLEKYLRENQSTIIAKAKGINPIKAFMNSGNDK